MYYVVKNDIAGVWQIKKDRVPGVIAFTGYQKVATLMVEHFNSLEKHYNITSITGKEDL